MAAFLLSPALSSPAFRCLKATPLHPSPSPWRSRRTNCSCALRRCYLLLVVASLSGLALAAALSRHGIDAMVLERAPSLDSKGIVTVHGADVWQAFCAISPALPNQQHTKARNDAYWRNNGAAASCGDHTGHKIPRCGLDGADKVGGSTRRAHCRHARKRRAGKRMQVHLWCTTRGHRRTADLEKRPPALARSR